MIDLIAKTDAATGETGGRRCGHPATYFFALDTDGRIAWPFRYVQDAAGRAVAQRWRFGHWVASREAARFLTGEDDLCIPTDAATVDAWIARDRRANGLRLSPMPHGSTAEAVAAE